MELTNEQVVTAQLAGLGIHLTSEDIGEVAEGYDTLQRWHRVVDEMVDSETEPAVIFTASVKEE